jgi:hypothetical protein
MEDLPPEWPVTDDQIELGLRSNEVVIRRVTFQAVFVLTSCYFIRLHLHRPYAARCANSTTTTGFSFGYKSLPSLNGHSLESSKEADESAAIAAATAEQFINLLVHCRCDSSTPPERVFATDGLLAFHTFQLFTAAMFFSFHLIAAPTGRRASQCIKNIATARAVLRATPISASSGQLARNATMILDALAPLWEGEFVRMPPGPAKETFKTRLMARVRRLAFPYHNPDSHGTIDPELSAPGTSKAEEHVLNLNSSSTPVGSFGSSGTLMPDMSVSGRAPMSAPAWQHPSPGPTHRPPLPDTIASFKSGRPQKVGAAAARFASGAIDPAPAIQSTMPQQPLHYDMRGDYSAPDSVEGVGQPMSWGASVGIDAGEWAGFTQSMTVPPRLAAAPKMMVFHPADPSSTMIVRPENRTHAPAS